MKLLPYLLLSTLIAPALNAGRSSFDRERTDIRKIDMEKRSHDANYFIDRHALKMTVAAALAKPVKQTPQPHVIVVRDFPPQPIVEGPSSVQDYFPSTAAGEYLRSKVLAPLIETIEKN